MNIVIAGSGNVGRYLTERLIPEDHDIVVIDQREDVLDELTSQFDIRGVLGSASSLDKLNAAGVQSADIYVAATPSDETNLLSCLLVDGLNDNIRKICRVHSLVTNSTGLPHRVSALVDQFINTDLEATSALVKLVDLPGVYDVIDFADGQLRIVGIILTQEDRVIGKSLSMFSGLERDESMLVVAIVRDGTLIVPRGDDVFQERDIVYVACAPDKVDNIFTTLGRERKVIKSVVIWGGGSIAERVARELSERDISLKLIVSDPRRAELLASEIYNTLVISGDATDLGLLKEEAIEEADLFLAATNDDEDNIIATLLAKRFGCKLGAVVVDKIHYLGLLPDMGIDMVVNPRISAASSILKFVRGKSISSAFSTRDDSAEMLEVAIDGKSNITGKAIKDLPIPQDVIIAAILTEDSMVIPSGMDVVNAGDRIVVFGKRSAMPKLEKFLKVKISLFG